MASRLLDWSSDSESISDSDDEFFDALASEDKQVGSEGKETINKVVQERIIPTDVKSKEEEEEGNISHPVCVDGETAAESNLPQSFRTMEGEGKDEVSPDRLENERKTISKETTDNAKFEVSEDGDSRRLLPQDVAEKGDVVEGLLKEENEPDVEDGAVAKEDGEVEGEIDEERLRREREDAMPEEEREQLKTEAQDHKGRGNVLFKQNEFLDAGSAYTQALEVCPLCYKKERSIMYANRAACRVRQEQHENAIADCSKALELHPHYLKVWLRRANTYELMEKLDEALADFQKVLELDPSCYEARAACMRLPDQIKQRNEKLKEEMFGKLKDLGNMVLRPFGLSTNNFQFQQDPNTGSYSVNFSQNSGNGK